MVGKINKIYEPNKNEIILDIYNKSKLFLDICIDSSNCRINLTNHLKDNPKVAPNFCMVLRKYLSGSKISSVYSYNLDRIVVITFENYNELNDLVNYHIESIQVDGSGAMGPTYSYPGQDLWIMIPDESTINNAKTLINKALNNESIKN